MTVSRRGLLSALAVGGVGAVSGQAATALLIDRETFASELTAGIVDIVVDYWGDIGYDSPDLSAPDSTTDGSDVGIDIGDIGNGDQSRDLLRVRLPQDGETVNNPARVWLRADCPAPTTLGELLWVRLSYAEESGTRGTTIVSGSLREVADELREGVRLDGGPATDADGCLADAMFVLVEYDLDGYVGSERVSLPLSFGAVQCRNTDPSVSPFGAVELDACQPGYDCTCCWAIGKVEVDDDDPLTAGETYPFTYGLDGYGIEVTDVDGDGGVAFTLVSTAGLPVLPLCSVWMKGGRDDEEYHRSGESFGFSTDTLDGATDGLIYTPGNGNNGGNYGISNIVVAVCAPETDDGECPADLVARAASVDGGPGGGNGGGRGGRQ